MATWRSLKWGTKAGYVLWGLPLAGLAVLLWWGYTALDREDPWIIATEAPGLIGSKASFTVKAGDKDSGLKELKVTLKQGELEKVIISRTFPPGGDKGLEAAVPVTVEPKALGFKEGKAVLTVTARDRSWRQSFQGRTSTLSREVTIDLVPVHLSFLSVNHLLHYGGTGVIIYKLNKEVKESGVLIGGRLYQGYPVPKGPKGEYLALFPVPREPGAGFQVELAARPELGEEVRQKVPPLKLKPRRWRQDKLNLSENFVRQVAANLGVADPDPLQGFLKVNRDMRQANHEKVREVCRAGRPEQLWSGAFGRFLGKPMARFGDGRTYIYQGRVVDQQVHQGEDLASLERSPVPASNHGVAAFAGPLGIYGNTVLLDHGLGVFSMYSHLSQIDVKQGDKVEKGARLGLTGATGLAGGDHLHFAMLVQGEFVDPVEWWDPHWHKDQLQGQIARAAAAAAAGSEGVAAAEQAGKKDQGKKKGGKGKKGRR